MALGGAVVLLATLALHPESAWYPACPVWQMFHVRCPGCGATRALAALLQGRMRDALRWNALFVSLAPWLAVYAGMAYGRAVGWSAFAWPRVQPAAVYGLLGIAVGFAVIRNL